MYVNAKPVAVADVATVAENQNVTIDVLANDSDPDTAADPTNIINPATVTITSAPKNGGTVVVNPGGTLSYTPRLNFRGTEVFRYRVRDNLNAQSNAATVRVNVQ